MNQSNKALRETDTRGIGELDKLIPKSGKLTDLQRRFVIEHSNPEWWKSKFKNGEPITSQYDDADWWRFNEDELTLTLKEVQALLASQQAKLLDWVDKEVIGTEVEVANIKDLEEKVYIVPAQNQLRQEQRQLIQAKREEMSNE